MFKRLIVILPLFFAALFQNGPVAPVAGQETDGVIRVRGANAMATLSDQWANAFMKANAGLRVMVSGGGTDAGFEALFDKQADVVMATRRVLEKELQAAALSECKLVETEVCSDAVAVITHPGNPVSELTLDQLGQILRGRYVDWKEVGGPPGHIKLILGPTHSGTAMFLRSRVMEDDYFSSDAPVRDFYHHVIRDLSRSDVPTTLSVASLADAEAAAQKKLVKIIAVKKDAESPGTVPSAANLRDGSYPLIRPLYFYFNETTVTPAAKKFVDFCKNQCQVRR